MTDRQRWSSADITHSWHGFKTSNCDTCQPQSTHTHTHTQTEDRMLPSSSRPFTSAAITHQIYLHWSGAKNQTPPPRRPPPPHNRPAAKSNHGSILVVIDRLPIQLSFSQTGDGEEVALPCSKPLGRRCWQGGLAWWRAAGVGRGREVIEED